MFDEKKDKPNKSKITKLWTVNKDFLTAWIVIQFSTCAVNKRLVAE